MVRPLSHIDRHTHANTHSNTQMHTQTYTPTHTHAHIPAYLYTQTHANTQTSLSGYYPGTVCCCPEMSGITAYMLSEDGRFASMASMFDDDDDDDRDTKRDNNLFTCEPVCTFFMNMYPKPAMHKTLCCWLHLATAKIPGTQVPLAGLMPSSLRISCSLPKIEVPIS